MDVMAAGMHNAFIQGTKRHLRRLFDWQCIHIGPEHQKLPRLAAVNYRHDSRLHRTLLIWYSHPPKLLHNQPCCLIFFKGQLRFLMNHPADSDRMLLQAVGQPKKRFHLFHLSLASCHFITSLTGLFPAYSPFFKALIPFSRPLTVRGNIGIVSRIRPIVW